ncbi:MAG: hypothetical protein HYT07_03085 [Candidatus Levybacteria bacterium]|nr:hypothetical protein [Candidatus Levybacteria bacterium]
MTLVETGQHPENEQEPLSNTLINKSINFRLSNLAPLNIGDDFYSSIKSYTNPDNSIKLSVHNIAPSKFRSPDMTMRVPNQLQKTRSSALQVKDENSVSVVTYFFNRDGVALKQEDDPKQGVSLLELNPEDYEKIDRMLVLIESGELIKTYPPFVL